MYFLPFPGKKLPQVKEKMQIFQVFSATHETFEVHGTFQSTSRMLRKLTIIYLSLFIYIYLCVAVSQNFIFIHTTTMLFNIINCHE